MIDTIPRWRATIRYHGAYQDAVHGIEELEELQELVERGPDFRSIKQIIIEYASEDVAQAA